MALIRRRPLLLGLTFVLAIAVTFVFGFRAGAHARRIRRQNDPVRPWMSVPFIAHTHHVPPEILFQAIGVQPRDTAVRLSVDDPKRAPQHHLPIGLQCQ